MRTAELQAGRELDAEVARQVMGWGVTVRGDEYLGIPPQPVLGLDEVGPRSVKFQPVPHYSTDIAAAWAVLSRLIKQHEIPSPDGIAVCYGSEGGWYCCLSDPVIVKATADTAPLAICRAVLATVHGLTAS